MKTKIFCTALSLLVASTMTSPAILIDAANPSGQLTGAVPGGGSATALFRLANGLQPTGTGVFKPFLTLNSQGNGTTEQAYNTPGGGVLDAFSGAGGRNKSLQLSELLPVDVDGGSYYLFTLDANEPASNPNNRLSIDNIRIYLSSTSDSTVENPDDLGSLVFALNDPLVLTPEGNPNFVNLDAAFHGSGAADMFVYIPTAVFGADLSKYVYFYNLNGIREGVEPGNGATGTFEEWAASTGRRAVPDGGATVALLGIALLGMAGIRIALSKKLVA